MLAPAVLRDVPVGDSTDQWDGSCASLAIRSSSNEATRRSLFAPSTAVAVADVADGGVVSVEVNAIPACGTDMALPARSATPVAVSVTSPGTITPSKTRRTTSRPGASVALTRACGPLELQLES